MATLELHPSTTQLVARLRKNMPQGVLLKGNEGVGLLTLARYVAERQLAAIVAPTDKDGNVTADGEIRVAQIRELMTQLRGKSDVERVVIIDDADRMNTAAQNSFLKLLEEPTDRTHFILTSHHPERLLATIVSRVQASLIHDISREQSQLLIKRLGETDPRRVQQLLFLAAGRPAEMTRLIQHPERFQQLASAVEDARTFLGGSVSQRTEVVQKYHNDRIGALRMIEQAIHMLDMTLRNKPTQTILDSANLLTTIHARLRQNGNVRLQLLVFVVQ